MLLSTTFCFSCVKPLGYPYLYNMEKQGNPLLHTRYINKKSLK